MKIVNHSGKVSKVKLPGTTTPQITTTPQLTRATNLDFEHAGLANKEEKKNLVFSFFSSLSSLIRGIFSFGKKHNAPKVSGEKVKIASPIAKSPNAPPVEIYDNKLDIDFVKNNIDKYVFVFSGNVAGYGGRNGQSTLLRYFKDDYPESIVELPVTMHPASVVDPSMLPKVSFKEDSVEQVAENLQYIENALNEAIRKSLTQKKKIFLLKGGYGTGGARMYALAPKTFKGMSRLFEEKLGVRFLVDTTTAQYSLVKVEDDTSSPVVPKSNADEIDEKRTIHSPKADNPFLIDGWSVVNHAA